MPRIPPGKAYCTEINSIGLRCAHLATHGEKCGYHNPMRRRCAALKEDGSRCEKIPMIGGELCAAHAGWKQLVAHDNVGRPDPTPPLSVPLEDAPFEEEAKELENSAFLLDITDCREFAKAVLQSRDFRQYIVDGLKRRDIPATLLLRLMDYADGWGKPVERVEHTGKDGQPIETVTEVRRVVIRVDAKPEVETIDAVADKPQLTH